MLALVLWTWWAWASWLACSVTEEAPHDPLKPHQSPWETSQTLLDFWASFSSGESTIDSDSLIYLLTAAALYRSVIMFIMSASFITSFISCIFSLRPTCFKQLRLEAAQSAHVTVPQLRSLLMTGGFVTQLLFNWRSQRTKDTAATNPLLLDSANQNRRAGSEHVGLLGPEHTITPNCSQIRSRFK